MVRNHLRTLARFPTPLIFQWSLLTTFKEQDNFVQIQGESRVKQGFVSTERYVNIFSKKKTAASLI
jgi:hypothetical protein